MKHQEPVDAEPKRPRVFGFSLTFWRDRALRRALTAFGKAPQFGLPRSSDQVLIWGRAGTAKRGQMIAQKTSASVLCAEDGFLRSVRTGRQGDGPQSVVFDKQGIYFEADKPSDLKDMLAKSGNISDVQVRKSQDLIAFMAEHHLSKYNDFPVTLPDLPDGFVLVIDQTRHDASISGAGADEGTFQRMLDAAKAENPDAAIVVKTHPETLAGQRRGYFDAADGDGRVQLLTDAVSPWALMNAGQKVYCVSSTMGMEAIFAGHRPVVFGNAFYCGLGLTDDRHPATVQGEPRSAEQLFHAAYVDYCRWYDPFLNRETDCVTVANTLAAQAAFARTFKQPQVLVGMRMWKRGFLKRFFKGTQKPPLFIDDVAKAVKTATRDGADVLVWSGKETAELAEGCAEAGLTLYRVEDGFLRSAGLGAELIEPVSLALDDLGIYYDPTCESRLERLIANSVGLSKFALRRAAAVREKMVALKLSKYNLQAAAVDLPKGRHTVLIPGQVENDQSILKGAGKVRTNLDLVRATREAFPDSFLIYKPHPDVMAGLRDGGADEIGISEIVDLILPDADIAMLLDQVDHVSTITSLTGFEALMRGKDVTCFGAPFYAGWGLTDDRGDVPKRRIVQANLDGLIHATLIDYPLYWDPVTGIPCTIETVLGRFAQGQVQRSARGSNRWLAKAQGLFASYAYLWR